MDEFRIKGWNDLTEKLFESSWQEPLRRFRGTFAFRGMPCADDDLRTSLARLQENAHSTEGHLLRNFRKYALRNAIREVFREDSVWYWLALGQHHGLPTRLLDWTFSPYIAAHFATDDLSTFDADGVIWQVDYTRCNALLPDGLKEVLAREGSDVFTAEMLDGAAPSLPDFDSLDGGPFVVFYEPPSLDDRIVNQFALFSMMSDPAARLDEWLERKRALARRIIIPAGAKWEIRDKLDQANITERVIFPGLDGLCRWLRRYYSPRTEGTDDESTSNQGRAQPD